MIPELQGYALIFRSTHGLFHRALDGITPEQALDRPNGANPMLFIAGHIVTVRASFMMVIGGSVEVPWSSHFRRGSEIKNQDQWPSLTEVRAKWEEVHKEFMSQLETVTSEQLSSPTESPGLDNTVLGTLGLAALHDSYHVGQLAAARRRYGLERIVG